MHVRRYVSVPAFSDSEKFHPIAGNSDAFFSLRPELLNSNVASGSADLLNRPQHIESSIYETPFGVNGYIYNAKIGMIIAAGVNGKFKLAVIQLQEAFNGNRADSGGTLPVIGCAGNGCLAGGGSQ